MAWDDIFTRPGEKPGETILVFRSGKETIIVPLDFDDAVTAREALNFRLYNMPGSSPDKAAGVIRREAAPAHLALLPSPASGR